MPKYSLGQPSASISASIARFEIHEGRLDEFKRLSAECIQIVRTKDTGMLQYDIYFNDDQSECVVHERYRDSAALNRAHRPPWRPDGGNPSDGLGLRRTPWCAERRAQSVADSGVRLFTPFQSM
jgi:Antibiotic biosynthesis monooxygenase